MVATLSLHGCGGVESSQGCSSDLECKGERICEHGRCISPVVEASAGGDRGDGSSTGYCTATSGFYSGDLDGLDGADRRCQAEFPGSHFYRRSVDQNRLFRSSFGFAELELGSCWDCNSWTSSSSGTYDATHAQCPTGYATVGALVPPVFDDTADPSATTWRICEAIDKPLMCCVP